MNITVLMPALLEVKVTDCNNCWYSATEAAPVNVTDPPPE